MKKIALKYGLISGLFISTFTVLSMAYCHSENNYGGNMLLGYSAMLLAFSLVFVAVKSYRDKQNSGVISFSMAFQIGLYITLISSTIYLVAWAIDYHFFIPDFMEKYCTAILENLKRSGATSAQISAKSIEMASMKETYKNPFMFVLFTYAEIFPVGLIVSLITALVVKRKIPIGRVTIA